jgi:hypothetical protein
MLLRVLVAIFSLLMLTNPARAELLVTFYSHDYDVATFPHAFVRLQGQAPDTGQDFDVNFGFTAKHTTPAILTGSVTGVIETKKLKYVESSDAHFTVRLTEEQYRQMLDLIETWKNLPGKSYNLGKRNCIHFTMEAAALLGLKVNRESKFFKKPKSFLEEVKSLNPDLDLIAPAPVPVIAQMPGSSAAPQTAPIAN